MKPNENFKGDYIILKNRKIDRISRNKKTNLFASGIQIINPNKINKILKNRKIDNFNKLWRFLIKKNKIGYTKVYKKKWSSFDTAEQIKKYQNKR